MEKKSLVKGTVFGFCLLVGYFLLMIIANSLTDNKNIQDLLTLAVQILVFIAAYFKMKKSYDIDLGFGTKGLKDGMFRYGGLMFIVIIANLFTEYMHPEITFSAAFVRICVTFLSKMGVGLAEDMIFRGVFFNVFKDRLGGSRKGLFISMIVSSSIFGAIHLLNLTGNPQLIMATLAQVIYAVFIGCFFCVVYYRSKNIWSCVILHGLVDFTGSFWKCFADPAKELVKADNTIWMSVFEVGVCLILFVSAMIQLRKATSEREIDTEPAYS